MGLASLCQNFDFTRDSGGPTQAVTRAGINTSMQCLDLGAPVTGLFGFVYEPTSATDPFFQLPTSFQPSIGSQYENPVGTGRMVQFPLGNFAEPLSFSLQITNVAWNSVGLDNQAEATIEGTPPRVGTPIVVEGCSNPFFDGDWTVNNVNGKVVSWHIAGVGAQNGNGGTINGTASSLPHAMDAAAANRIFRAYSDLMQPLSGLANINPKTKALNPFGMKPFGFTWQPGIPVLQGEICTPPTPVTGNGHTYQAQNSGTTGQNPPVFPTGEGATVVDNGITWKELTMVIANRLPNPPAPTEQSFVAGTDDIYVVLTFVNPTGESLPGPALVVPNSDTTSLTVDVPALNTMPGWVQNLPPAFLPTGFNVYCVAVAHGSAAPPLSTYEKMNPSATIPFGGNLGPIPNGVTGPPPPTTNGARVTPGQLPTPTTEPIIDRNPGGGAFAAGQDVYVLMTFTKLSGGETPAGPANSVVNTTLNDAIQVDVEQPLGPDNTALFDIYKVGIYEADVPTGSPAPPSSEFSLVGYFAPGTTQQITTTATGANPPLTNTTGPAGNIAPDTATGGPNGTQGFRYAACMFMDDLETVSGFTQASVVSTIIDEGGWEIGVFNIPTGPAYIIGRVIAFTIADGLQSGSFWWTGLVDLLAPAQNVVYPTQTLVDQVEQSATVILDNVTTQATFNFTDSFLISENNVDDRLSLAIPPQGVRVDYLEAADRLCITGVPGTASGAWISLGEDYESFDAADSRVPISSEGDICYGVSDKYKGIPFAMMASGGFTLTPNTGNPNSWAAQRRWGGIDPGQALGPCGFRAWDACGKFIIFAHQSGLYKYDLSNPDMMSKEVPRRWGRINWAAKQTVCVKIDEDTHTVRVLVPTGASTVPNYEYVLSYIEGWNNPIHFSTYSGKEISMDAARRWSFNPNVSAYICARLQRTMPANGQVYIDGPSYETIPDSSFLVTQLLYASSSFDGTVQARTPGIFSDNGAAIDYQYETMSNGLMQAVCKPEGFNLNATGGGTLLAFFIASRSMVTDEGGEEKLVEEDFELPCEPIPLSPKQMSGITRRVEPAINEFWRVRFTGNKQPGDWVSLKALTSYMILFTVGRDSTDR